MRKMGLRGRSQEEQLLPQRRVGGSPHSSALLNGAAHEYCMIPEVGLPGRAEPSRGVALGLEPAVPVWRAAPYV